MTRSGAFACPVAGYHRFVIFQFAKVSSAYLHEPRKTLLKGRLEGKENIYWEGLWLTAVNAYCTNG